MEDFCSAIEIFLGVMYVFGF